MSGALPKKNASSKLHHENAISPILVTLAGITMLVRALQRLNALSPILVMLLGSAEVLRHAMERGVLSTETLYGTEPEVIAALTGDADTRAEWEHFCALHEMLHDRNDAPDGAWRVIPAKKRCIDPLICGSGRLSEVSAAFAAELAAFLQEPQDVPLCAR